MTSPKNGRYIRTFKLQTRVVYLYNLFMAKHKQYGNPKLGYMSDQRFLGN